MDEVLEKLGLVVKNKVSEQAYRWAYNKLKKTIGEKSAYDTFDALKAIETVRGSSKVTLFYLLKKLYRIAGWEWDDSLISTPKLDQEYTADTPTLDREFIEKTIRGSKELDDLERAIWVFSTVWGMRRGEIRWILSDPESIDLKNDPPRLKIRTLKGGVSRWSLIPQEVVDKLTVKLPVEVNAYRLSYMFHLIVYKTTGEIRPNNGYHSIRRSLIVYLLPPYTTLSAEEVFRFMRWSERGAGFLSILYRYASTAKELEWFDLDRRIYEQHPWLKCWGEV